MYTQVNKKEFKHNTKFSHQITGEENKTEREEKYLQEKPKTIKKMARGIYILIITLNANGLNTTTISHRVSEWVQKQDSYICYLQETHFRSKDTYRLKVWDEKRYSM